MGKMIMKQAIVFLSVLLLVSCNPCSNNNSVAVEKTSKLESDKIKVLNFGSFHFGVTPDQNTTEFDEDDKKNRKEIRAVIKMLAEFNPTIICVEGLPEYNYELNRALHVYLEDPSELNSNWGEASMIGFEIARLCHVKQVYGIDNAMGYNYSIGKEIKNSIDSVSYNTYTKSPFKNFPEIAERKKKLQERFTS